MPDSLGKRLPEDVRALQIERCIALLQEEAWLRSRAIGCRARAEAIAKSWQIDLDKLPKVR